MSNEEYVLEDLDMSEENHRINNHNGGYISSDFIENNSAGHSLQHDTPTTPTIPQHFEGQDHYTGTSNRRVQTARDASRGIENILMEMPSRTIGRSTGKRLAKRANSSGSAHYGSYSRFLKTHVLTHQDVTDGVTNEAAQHCFDEIAATHNGEVELGDIRNLPVNMQVKKRIRNLANSDIDRKKLKYISGFKMWKYNAAIKRAQFKEMIRKGIRSPKLWNTHLKQVEGNFGSGVSSYFSFLRGLFFLSIPSFILNFAFISLPQLLVPQPRSDPDINFTGEELITGANWLTETIMYYGYYTNETIQVIEGAIYQMPLAYLLATTGYFILCLIWITSLTATSFRENYIQGKVSYSNFIGKTFCAWDYSITSGSVATLHQKIISTDIKEVLAEKLLQNRKRSSSQTFKLYMLRLFIWTLYLAIAIGSATLIYYLLERLLEDISQPFKGVVILEESLLAIIVSAINLVVPIFINLFTHFEQYGNPRHELYVAVSRNYLLKVGLLGVICAFWTDDTLQPNIVSFNNTNCWETRLGQEIYRLVIIDFLFSILFATFCAEFLRRILSKFCCSKLQRAKFSIVNNVMDLVYGQTLCWIGVFFSPLLAFIVIIKYFILFYVKKISLMQNCRAAKKQWRAAQSRTMFNGLLLISFLLSAIFLCVVVFRKTPSMDCGPYRGLDRTYDSVAIVFDDLYQSVDTGWFATLMAVITSIWFLSAINTILVILIVLRSSKAYGYATLGKALREQIVLEGQDKKLLLKWLQQLTNQPNFLNQRPKSVVNQHRVPILQDLPSGSNPSLSPNNENIETEMLGNVLTHVDPQHVGISNLATSSSGTSVQNRKKHIDPFVNRALANKDKQRPFSMFVGDNVVESDNSRPHRSSFSGQIEMEVINRTSSDNESETESSVSLNYPSAAPSSSFQGNVYI